MNACIGEKIAAVSKKAQTTRNQIRGIITTGSTQLVFVDTPGLHKGRKLPAINSRMMQEAWRSLEGLDLACYLIDTGVGISTHESLFLKQLCERANCPVLILLTKTDKYKNKLVDEKTKEVSDFLRDLAPHLSTRVTSLGFSQPLQCSAKAKDMVKNLIRIVCSAIPQGEWQYDVDAMTDVSTQFLVSEFIREQIFRQLGDELPYGSGVMIDRFEEKEVTHIDATIYVPREGHKRIMVGKQGKTIKAIGSEARKSVENLLQNKVMLRLFVSVEKKWTEHPGAIHQIQGI
ncbi:MAG: GTPase Era [Zetaproteobacteria bacterium]|nr:GTPase Era [Zetaproteobacteria bacterium]